MTTLHFDRIDRTFSFNEVSRCQIAVLHTLLTVLTSDNVDTRDNIKKLLTQIEQVIGPDLIGMYQIKLSLDDKGMTCLKLFETNPIDNEIAELTDRLMRLKAERDSRK